MLSTQQQGGTAMATAIATRCELARRASNGIEVTLFWIKPTNRVSVEVLDSRFDEVFEFEVDGSVALEAFNHPFAYAASHCPRQGTEALAT
jgi:hypothetical protein